MKKEKVSVYNLLRKKYPAVECVLMSEVSDSTGFRNRSADHIVVNLWPSRGNSIIGFEVKSWRSDWLRELKDPKKQEAIYKFCDYFYLLTDEENVAKIDEIPSTWGWMHVHNGKLKTMKDAPKLTPIQLSKQFVCAMLRRADCKENFVHIDSIQDRVNETIEQHKESTDRQTFRKLKEYDELQKQVQEFEESSGIKISDRWEKGGKIGEAVNVILSGGAEAIEKRMIALKEAAEGISNTITNKLKLLNAKEETNTVPR